MVAIIWTNKSHLSESELPMFKVNGTLVANYVNQRPVLRGHTAKEEDARGREEDIFDEMKN